MAVWGGGAVFGSGAYARWRRRSATALIAGSAVALGLGFAIMAVAPSLPVALAGAAIAGAGNSVEWVAARTAIQQRTPAGWMALMMGLTESMSQLAPGLGIALGGLITALAMSRVAFGVAAAGSLLFAAAVPVVLRGGYARVASDGAVSAPTELADGEEILPRGKSLV
jgi:MFS family permease